MKKQNHPLPGTLPCIVRVQKISIPISRVVIGNSGGLGSQQPNFLRESRKLNWKGWGGGVQTKQPSLVEM